MHGEHEKKHVTFASNRTLEAAGTEGTTGYHQKQNRLIYIPIELTIFFLSLCSFSAANWPELPAPP
jgi:hypothetical protein